MIKSVTDKDEPRFDFVTFYGGQFEERLKGGFYSELQYIPGSKPQIDLVIFDIEYLDDLRVGVQFAPNEPIFRLVPFEDFLTDRDLREILTIPPRFKTALQSQNRSTSAIPLRWGYTGVAVKLDPGSRAVLNRQGVSFSSETGFDLTWITDEACPLYRWLRDPNEPCWIISLDWYLPTMMLIAWELFPTRFHTLTEQELQQVRARMQKLIPLMHPSEPLIIDPLRLAERMHTDENLIVIGGGNWLQLLAKQNPVDLMLLPTAPGYLLWCECLGFLAPDGHPPDKRWALDAKELVQWFLQRQADIMNCSSFHAFQPNDLAAYQQFSHKTQLVRQLPPNHSDGSIACRERWQEEWQNWRLQVLSQANR